MHLSVFAELAKSGVISGVIISTDPTDERKRTVVDLKTVFGKTVRLTTAAKKLRATSKIQFRHWKRYPVTPEN